MNWYKIYSKILGQMRKELTVTLDKWKVNTDPQKNVPIKQIKTVVIHFLRIKKLHI